MPKIAPKSLICIDKLSTPAPHMSVFRPSSVKGMPLICQACAPHLSCLTPLKCQCHSQAYPQKQWVSPVPVGVSPSWIALSSSESSRRPSNVSTALASAPLICQSPPLICQRTAVSSGLIHNPASAKKTSAADGAYGLQVSLSHGPEGQGASVPAGRVAPSLGLGVKRQRARGIAGA